MRPILHTEGHIRVRIAIRIRKVHRSQHTFREDGERGSISARTPRASGPSIKPNAAFAGICIPKEESQRDRGRDVRDRGCATGRQGARIESGCYIHVVGWSLGRSVGRSAPGPNYSDDFPALPLILLSLSPPLLSFFPRGVAFNRPGCPPTFFLPLPFVSSPSLPLIFLSLCFAHSLTRLPRCFFRRPADVRPTVRELGKN